MTKPAADALPPEDPEQDEEQLEQPNPDGIVREEIRHIFVEDEDEEHLEDEGADPADEGESPAAPAAQVPAPAAGPGTEAPAAAPEGEGQPPAPEAETPTPLVLSFDGKKVEVERGISFSETLPDGTREKFVLMPESSFVRAVQPNLADRGVWREREKAYLQQLAERDPEHNEEVVKSRKMLDFFNGLLELGEDELLDAIQKFRDELPRWELEQEKAALTARLDARDGVRIEPDAEQIRIAEEEVRGVVESDLGARLAAVTELEGVKGLVDADTLREELAAHVASIYFIADEDMPQLGLRKGQIGIIPRNGEQPGGEDIIAQIVVREVTKAKRIADRFTAGELARKKNAEQLEEPRKRPVVKPPEADAPPRPGKDDEGYDAWLAGFLGESQVTIV